MTDKNLLPPELRKAWEQCELAQSSLRHYVVPRAIQDTVYNCKAALEHIVKLREELARVYELVNHWNTTTQTAEATIERLTRAIEKVISYNEDIDAGRINYRPKDHIEVLRAALASTTGGGNG